MGTSNIFPRDFSHTSRSHELDRSTPLMLRTSLVERLAAANGGNRELLPITLLPDFLPISYQTIRNQLSGGRTTIGAGGGSTGLEIVRFNSRVYVRTEDLLRLIWNSASETVRKKRGRKSNRQKAEEKSSESTFSSAA